jgi:hypothetical protein
MQGECNDNQCLDGHNTSGVCRTFAETGRCRYGRYCKFVHLRIAVGVENEKRSECLQANEGAEQLSEIVTEHQTIETNNNSSNIIQSQVDEVDVMEEEEAEAREEENQTSGKKKIVDRGLTKDFLWKDIKHDVWSDPKKSINNEKGRKK